MKLFFSRVLASNQADRQGNKQSQVMVVTMSRLPAIRGVCVCVCLKEREKRGEGRKERKAEGAVCKVSSLPKDAVQSSSHVPICEYIMGHLFYFFFSKKSHTSHELGRSTRGHHTPEGIQVKIKIHTGKAYKKTECIL